MQQNYWFLYKITSLCGVYRAFKINIFIILHHNTLTLDII